jgi:hypothetical protein
MMGRKKKSNGLEGYNVIYPSSFETPEKYIKERLLILKRDFLIEPTEEELDHLHTLKTEIAIDAAIRKICNSRWEEK